MATPLAAKNLAAKPLVTKARVTKALATKAPVTKALPAKEVGWHVVASALVLFALLTAPIAIVATMASPQPKSEVVATGDFSTLTGLALDNPAMTDPGNMGSFAFGFIEFDVDPRRPGGVTGFDSWPPGSPRR